MSYPAAEIEARLRTAAVMAAAIVLAGAAWTLWMGNQEAVQTLSQLPWVQAHRRTIRLFSDYTQYPFYFFFLGLLVYGRLRKQRDLVVVAYSYWTAMLLGAFLTVRIIKMTAGHARPDAVGLAGGWFGPSWDNAYHSFPSGHSADLFTSAIFVALLLPNIWLRLLALLVATLVALSRVFLAKHFPVDVVAGAAVGVVVSVLVIHYVLRPRLRAASPAPGDPKS